MFTVCPKCALTLAVTAADLRLGQGYVRCGRCASVFNALAALHDEQRQEGTPPAADRRAATPSPPPPPLMMEVPAAPAPEEVAEPRIAEIDVDLPAGMTSGTDSAAPDTMEFALGSADLAQIFVAPEVTEGESGSGTFESIVLEGGLPGDEDDAPDMLAQDLESAEAELERIARAARDAVADPGSGTAQFEALRMMAPESAPAPPRDVYQPRAEDIDAFEDDDTRSRSSLRYGALAAVLVLLLIAQIVHRSRNELALSPILNGPLTALYANLGRPLAPRWDPAALDVRQLGAIAPSGASGQLLVRASIRNEASRPQPMPLLRLTLQDRYGKRIASRDLTPREYLGARASERAFLDAGQRVDAEVAVVDPGNSAVGFEVDACLPNGRGGVACAGDAAAVR
ncbi:MAG: zinc-ribbon and DUF3426 domain-containing protein [Steroidobacteraceae bacterium]